MRNDAKGALLIAAAACMTALAGCGGGETSGVQNERKAIPAKLASAQVMDIARYADAPATVSAQFNVDMSTRISGRIAQIYVKQGDRIKRGELLLSLDPRDLDAALTQADSDIAAANAAYSGAVSGEKMTALSSSAQIDEANAQIAQAKAALSSALARRDEVYAGPRKQERETAEQNVKRAAAALDLAKKTFARMDSLYKVEAITPQQRDEAKSSLDSALAAYNSAVQNKNMIDEGSRIEDKKAADDAVKQAKAALAGAFASLDQAKAGALQTAVKRSDIRQAKAMIAKSRAELSGALANRSYASLYAPFDGVVADRLSDPGSMANPGAALLKVEGGAMQIDANAPESLLPYIKVGRKVSVSTGAPELKSVFATVVSISPQGDADSHTFLVKAVLPPASPLKSGMYARIRVKTGHIKAILAPSSAIVDREGLKYVYVDVNGAAQMRLVTVGQRVGALSSILSGLQEGDKVVISNLERISDNAPIAEAN